MNYAIGVHAERVEAEDEFPVERQIQQAPVNWSRGEMIGAGAFGRVYLALNNDSGELMAVKQARFLSRGWEAQCFWQKR